MNPERLASPVSESDDGDPDRERVFDQAVAEIDEVEQGLAWALERTSLPDEPDRVAVAGSWWRPTGAPGGW